MFDFIKSIFSKKDAKQENVIEEKKDSIEDPPKEESSKEESPKEESPKEEVMQKYIVKRTGQLDLEFVGKLLFEKKIEVLKAVRVDYDAVLDRYKHIFNTKIISLYLLEDNIRYVASYFDSDLNQNKSKICDNEIEVLRFFDYSDYAKQMMMSIGLDITEKIKCDIIRTTCIKPTGHFEILSPCGPGIMVPYHPHPCYKRRKRNKNGIQTPEVDNNIQQ